MPQVAVATLVGVGAYVGLKLVAREMRRIGRVLGEIGRTTADTASVPVQRLVAGADGIYRPER